MERRGIGEEVCTSRLEWVEICDKRVSARMKEKVYKMVVRPVMLYGLETVALRTDKR